MTNARNTSNRSKRDIRGKLCIPLTATIIMLFLPLHGHAQEPAAIKLNEPDKKRGLPLMEALSVRASSQVWADTELSLQDISDLLWAANGINRPEEKKYTASSAMNAHDIDLYVFTKDGAYLYAVDNHALIPVACGDFRAEILKAQPRPAEPGAPPPPPRPSPANAPVIIVLISESARFKTGTPDKKLEWGAIDTGIVSQNISLFCAATGLKTRPRGSMDKEKIRALLKLKDSQTIFLNHPVGHAK